MTHPTIRDIRGEIVQEAIQGNVALWLASDWELEPAEGFELLLDLPWLGVWSESTDRRLARELQARWASDGESPERQLCEVPNRLEETLGRHYSLAQICPVFYLRGREREWERLPERERRRARDEKVDEVIRLGPSVLLLVGFSKVKEIVRVLLDELPEVNTDIRFVVANANEELLTSLAEKLLARRREIVGRVRGLSWSLQQLADKASEVVATEALQGTHIRVRNEVVSIEDVLQREGPIDQDFVIVTVRDLGVPPEASETSELVESFMAGRSFPWAALSRNALWKRHFEKESPYDCVRDVLQARRARRAAPVTCLSIAAERGSGLTTLLQEIAYRSAQEGYPALLRRGEAGTVDYEALRTYLEHVQHTRDGIHPAVLVIDDADSASNNAAGIPDLPQRLARDGRHAVFVRGIRLRPGQALDDQFFSENRLPGSSSKVEQIWCREPIRERLTNDEVDSLCKWASAYWPSASLDALEHAAETWARDWEGEGDPPPLLVCLYVLLRDQFDQPAQLGRHLVSKVESLLKELETYSQEKEDTDTTGPVLSGEDLALAVDLLRSSFGKGEASVSDSTLQFSKEVHRPAPGSVSRTFVLLCMLGALRLVLPKRLLATILHVPALENRAAVRELEALDLVSEFQNPADQHSGMNARDAYYTVASSVGVRHPSFGKLALDYLLSNGNTDLLQGAEDWLTEVQKIGPGKLSDGYPIKVLIPIFRRLSASREDVEFAESVSQKLLRLQRVWGSHYHQWLFAAKQADNLLEVLDQIPDAVARQSASILHTRGITRYKSCSRPLPLDACRERYQKASEDLELAYDKAITEHEGEHPANIVTSHGLLYLGWSSQERHRTDEGGDPREAERTREKAKKYLRDGIRLRPDNPYAAFGLAEMLIEDCEECATDFSDANAAATYGNLLAEAFELLQYRPDATVAENWEDLQRRAIGLLEGQSSHAAIERLREAKEDLWRALEALQILEGRFPLAVTVDQREVTALRGAWKILGEAHPESERESTLSDLLRYGVFTSMPDRIREPAYHKRYSLVSRLEGSRFLENPVLLYDYAMLAYQSGEYSIAEGLFRRLRRGRRFLEVPLERAVPLYAPDSDGKEALIVRLRLVRTDELGRGWGSVQRPESMGVTIPLSTQDFRAAGSPVTPGSVVTARVRVQSAGLFAEPVNSRRARQRIRR